jgi:hypothetical protein
MKNGMIVAAFVTAEGGYSNMTGASAVGAVSGLFMVWQAFWR